MTMSKREALKVIESIKNEFDTLTPEGMFNWILELQELSVDCVEAVEILEQVKEEYDTITLEGIFNSILKVESYLKES